MSSSLQPAQESRTRCSLIIPVYRNADTIPALIEAVAGIAAALDGALEVVFVVDGSPDQSYSMLRQRLETVSFPSQLVGLSRNFGSFAAIRMGLECAAGPSYAVLAADLQEPPELIVAFFKALAEEEVDIVVGTRESREDPFWQSLFARLFWTAYRRLVQPQIPPGGVDIFGCNRVVRDRLLQMREANSTLVGLLFWLGFRRKVIPYRRRVRPSGRSAWSFRRRLRYLLDSCFALTDLPITLITVVGVFGSLFAVALSLVVLVGWLAGYITVAGYTPIILVLLNTFTINMLALGIIGGYVWRMFENTKSRPLYVPMLHERFPGNSR